MLVLVRLADVSSAGPLGGLARGGCGDGRIAMVFEGLAPRESASGSPQDVLDELTDAEARVLRYLPTNLTAGEIANELYVSVNTIKTHMRHIYAKIGAHRRSDAVARAHSLGMLPGTFRNAVHREARDSDVSYSGPTHVAELAEFLTRQLNSAAIEAAA